MERLLRLVQAIREAESAGFTWEVKQVAGRPALRIQHAEGVNTNFLSEQEQRELQTALTGPTPTLSVQGLPMCSWSVPRRSFVGQDGAVEVVVETSVAPEDRDMAALARAAAAYQLASGRLPDIRHEVAKKLAAIATAWSAPKRNSELASRLTLSAFHLSDSAEYADRPRIWMRAGDAFGGHSIEVSLDSSGVVIDAALAG